MASTRITSGVCLNCKYTDFCRFGVGFSRSSLGDSDKQSVISTAVYWPKEVLDLGLDYCKSKTLRHFQVFLPWAFLELSICFPISLVSVNMNCNKKFKNTAVSQIANIRPASSKFYFLFTWKWIMWIYYQSIWL